MSKRELNARRSRLGRVLVVLGVVAAVMAIMPAAFAHHPEVTIGATCSEVSGTSYPWAGCSGASCANPQVQLQLRFGTNSTWDAWTSVTTSAYDAADGYPFNWGPVAWPAGKTRSEARVHVLANWGNGQAGNPNDYRYSGVVWKPACPAYVVINKVTEPAGDSQPFTIDLISDGQPAFQLRGGESWTSIALDPSQDNRYITESSVPGWQLTSGVCDQGETIDDIDLEPGETVTCTLTNTKQGRIIVDKVTNPTAETDFGFEASWIDRSGADFYLDDTDTPHDSGWLTPGNFDVHEVPPLPSGWIQTGASCSDGSPVSAISLQPGETVTCTFYNGPATGNIIIDKVTVPAGDLQSFEFNPSWSGTNFFLTDAGAPVNTAVTPGMYSIVELGVSGWDPTSAVCDQGETIDDIDLAAGETVTCVFTNTKLGRIRVDKVTDPAGDTTPFGINTSWAGEFNLRDLDVPYDSFWVLVPGAGFSVSEDPVAGWVLSSAACTGTVQGPIANLANFELKPGEQIDCVFDNHRIPTGRLTIIKDATPNDDTPFSFSGTYAGAPRATTVLDPFALRDPSVPSITLPQGPGAYVVTEGTVPAGWRFDDIACTGTSAWSHVGQTLSVAVGRDEAVACTFYNSGDGNIIVRKVTSPADAPAQSFTFDPSWSLVNFDLANGGSRDSGVLPAGIYSVAELGGLPEGWTAGAASCNDGSSPAAIGLSPGETVTCTFNNAYRGQEEEPEKAGLTIVKDAIPLVEPTSTVFGFSAGTLGTFQLGDGGSQSFEVDPGEYSVVETLPVGWAFAGVSCLDDSTGGAVPDGDLVRAVTVSLVADQHVTCTFLNRQERVAGPEGSLTIVKQTVPAGGTGFPFDAGALGTFILDDGGSQVFGELAAGAYTVTEIPAADWKFAQVECSALDYVVDGASVTVNLAEGEAAICTFTNGELPYTGSSPLAMPLLIAGLWAVLMGLAIGVWSLMRGADEA